MAANTPVARVSAIQGKVFAKSEDGSMRELKIGDPVFEGEILVALPGSQVDLATEDGRLLTLRENEVLTVDAEVAGDSKADATDSALLAASDDTNRIIQAINEGGNLGIDLFGVVAPFGNRLCPALEPGVDGQDLCLDVLLGIDIIEL